MANAVVPQTFAGQKLVVIGGSSGIGKAIARLVLERGGSAVIVGRNGEKLKKAIADLSSLGAIVAERADIADAAERNDVIDRKSTRLNSSH